LAADTGELFPCLYCTLCTALTLEHPECVAHPIMVNGTMWLLSLHIYPRLPPVLDGRKVCSQEHNSLITDSF